MKHIVLVLLVPVFFLVCCTSAFSDNYYAVIKVDDKEKSQPIGDALITVLDSMRMPYIVNGEPLKTLSDDMGHAGFYDDHGYPIFYQMWTGPFEEGLYYIICQKEGYETQQLEVYINRNFHWIFHLNSIGATSNSIEIPFDETGKEAFAFFPNRDDGIYFFAKLNNVVDRNKLFILLLAYFRLF